MNQRYANAIAAEFERCVVNTLGRLERDDSERPFHAALLTDEVLFWSRFERSFSTSFGQRTIEEISMLAALSDGASHATRQKETQVQLDSNLLQEVDRHISQIRGNSLNRNVNWETDLNSILSVPRIGRLETSRVISDLYWVKNGIENFMSIKTVMPNIDQTAEAKRDLLKLKAYKPNSNVYFGLYYNPYGDRPYAFSPPKRVFNFDNDRVVLLGKTYWETLGGQGFYDEIIKIAKTVGERTRPMLTNR